METKAMRARDDAAINVIDLEGPGSSACLCASTTKLKHAERSGPGIPISILYYSNPYIFDSYTKLYTVRQYTVLCSEVTR